MYIMQLQSGPRLNYAAAVDTTAGRLVDNDQPVKLNLWEAAFWIRVGCVQEGSKVVLGRRVVKM